MVLAGGRGSRLGGEGKASLELAGRPMLAYVLEALSCALDEVAVAAKASTALPGVSDGQALRVPGMSERVVLWTEPDRPRHPLAGLRHTLQRAGDRPVLACAVDLPLITPALVEEIAVADAQGAPAVVPLAPAGVSAAPRAKRASRGGLPPAPRERQRRRRVGPGGGAASQAARRASVD